jgi:trk system potassium uptake protein TrkA
MNVLILGAGEIGYLLSSKLIQRNYNITIIEQDEQKVKRASDTLDANIILGNATNFSLLKKLKIHSFDIIAAVTNNDEINILASLIAKKSGVKTAITRVRNPEYIAKDFVLNNFEHAPDLIIHPEKETAKVISRLVKTSFATDFYDLEDGRIKIVGLRLDRFFEHYNVKLIHLTPLLQNLPMRILAINRSLKTIIPKGDDTLQKGDQIYVIFESKYTSAVLDFFGKKDIKINNAMIVGGGLVGEYTAQELEEKINVKIIENESSKLKLLAENLKKSLIIQGDGTDQELLLSENITEMDEFIAVSGDDETNIITSMLARQLNVPRTITLLKKMEYLKVTHSIGLDTVVSKQIITVNAIRQFIHRRTYTTFAEIPGIDGIVSEMIAKKNTKLVKNQLKDIKLPENVIFGAVIKSDNSVEISTGSTLIEPGDKVIVFYKPEIQREIEKMF